MQNLYESDQIYSFWHLLEDQSIEIPIIQRDYAQGRKDKTEIRRKFLDALRNSIVNETPIKLDFIYGSKINGSFLPLDGQQRLTTLFLIHWYASIKDRMNSQSVKSILSKFTYETRSSSREFCQNLTNRPLSVDSKDDILSEKIVDSSWFFLSWKKDPTIDAMLRSIDDIHEYFYSIDSLWDKLLSKEIPVGFYHIELENFGLTDDLYIKMNARGKLLTPFENFKASFQKYVDDNNWDKGKEFTDTFACKVDTQWTDLFWEHRKQDKIDNSFMRFIGSIAMTQIVLEKSQDRIEKISTLQRAPNLVKVEYFSELGYEYLCNCLNIYYDVFEKGISLDLDFPFWQHQPVEHIFNALVYEGNVASYTQKVLFYAQTEYLLKNDEFNKEKFDCWMRVIRNIVSRGDAEKTGSRPAIIRSPETFDGVINLIQELSLGSNDIYTFLASNQIKSSFAKEQIEEEKLKAQLICNDNSVKEIIFSTEDTNFCQGRINFALDCINYQNKEDDLNVDELSKIQKVLKEYLENERVTNKLRRALLTIEVNGNYNYYDYWWSWSHAVGANKRCLIDRYRELEYYIYGSYKNRDEYKQYLKKLIIALTEKSIEELIEDFIPPDSMPNWKIRLIKEAHLLEDKCASNYIAIPEDESCCYLLRVKRPRDLDSCEKIE